MISSNTATDEVKPARMRFYRPELDALRFFAFLAVMIHHGPVCGSISSSVTAAGGFGLSMFFLLSAYLITSLLIREREESGTVAWGLFFTRRALRIWPLYYGAIAVAIVLALLWPAKLGFGRFQLAVMVVFLANWFRLSFPLPILIRHLWSISVEEQFYLLWPPIFKIGGQKLALITSICFVALAGVWLAVFSGKGWALWYDTPVEFLFFGAGAIIASTLRGRVLPA